LKTISEIIEIQEWNTYVEARKNLIGLEEKKEAPSVKWDPKARKEVQEPIPAQLKPKMSPEHPSQYGANLSYYPYYSSQGYSYQYFYSGYPRPPYQ